VVHHTNTGDRVLGVHIAPASPAGQYSESWADLLFVKGFDAGQPIVYISTDAGQPLTAVLERSTYVPALNNAPFNGGDDFLGSARERLFGFINGQTGADNPQAQGFQHLAKDGMVSQDASLGNSAFIDALRNGGDLLNVFGDFPTLSDPRHADAYSPLWDAQLGLWTQKAISAGLNKRQIDENEVFDRPDYVVFDLDPYIYSGKEAKGAEPEFNSPAFAKAREVAFNLREILTAMALQAFVKTTGKTGLHIFVPIERTITTEQARDVCRLVGEHLRRKHPKDITMEWAVEKRTGKIFFDHNMNGRGRTLNAAYSPRRIPGAYVATPVTWEELPKVEPTVFSLSTVPERLRDNGDPWQGILQARHDLTRVFTR